MISSSLEGTLQSFRWSNEPSWWHLESHLELRTDPDTDFWQRTFYGFRRDNGHFFYTDIEGDFAVTACLTFEPAAQYDQCGLMCRVDADTWIKCSTEYETPEFSRLGSVVTNLGYSDWATQDIASTVDRMYYTLNRFGDDFKIAWSPDGHDWRQMRIAHLHGCSPRLQVGVYACSPTGQGFGCRIDELVIAPSGRAHEA